MVKLGNIQDYLGDGEIRTNRKWQLRTNNLAKTKLPLFNNTEATHSTRVLPSLPASNISSSSIFSQIDRQLIFHDSNKGIKDLMKLFELESYKAWAAMELKLDDKVKQSENELEQTENYLDSVMEDAMEEFRCFESEMNATADAEYKSLINLGEKARNMGKSLERADSLASKRYIEAAVNSATSSMKSVMRAISSMGKKVHPS